MLPNRSAPVRLLHPIRLLTTPTPQGMDILWPWYFLGTPPLLRQVSRVEVFHRRYAPPFPQDVHVALPGSQRRQFRPRPAPCCQAARRAPSIAPQTITDIPLPLQVINTLPAPFPLIADPPGQRRWSSTRVVHRPPQSETVLPVILRRRTAVTLLASATVMSREGKGHPPLAFRPLLPMVPPWMTAGGMGALWGSSGAESGRLSPDTTQEALVIIIVTRISTASQVTPTPPLVLNSPAPRHRCSPSTTSTTDDLIKLLKFAIDDITLWRCQFWRGRQRLLVSTRSWLPPNSM